MAYVNLYFTYNAYSKTRMIDRLYWLYSTEAKNGRSFPSEVDVGYCSVDTNGTTSIFTCEVNDLNFFELYDYTHNVFYLSFPFYRRNNFKIQSFCTCLRLVHFRNVVLFRIFNIMYINLYPRVCLLPSFPLDYWFLSETGISLELCILRRYIYFYCYEY